MLKTLTAAACLALATVAVAPQAHACEGDEGMTAEIGSLTVDQLVVKLEARQKQKTTLAVFDVNSDKTRADKGIIPTAVLLPSSSDYDTALLPKDKSAEVVFYCAAEKCTASKTAAHRAVEAGHTNVSVMPAGIAGWLSAGKPIEKRAAPKAAAQPVAG